MAKKSYLRIFWGYVKPYKKPLRIVYLLYLTNSVLNLIPAYSLRYYIDLVLMGKDASLFGIHLSGFGNATLQQKIGVSFLFLAGAAGVIILANAVGVVMWRLATKNVEGFMVDMKLRIHHHINKLSLGFFNNERVGNIMTKAVSDVNNLNHFLRGSFSMAYQFVQLILAPVLMISLSPLLFTVTLLPVAIAFYAFYSIRVKLKPMYREQRENLSQINTQMQEVVSGIKEIKAFNLAEKTQHDYSHTNWRFYHIQNRIMRIFSINHQLQYGSRDLALVLIAIMGGILMFKGVGSITVGVIMSFIALSNMLYGPLHAFVGFFDMFQQGMVSLERIIDFLQVVPDIQDQPHAPHFPLGDIKGQVCYSHVSFSYNPGEPILEDVSFEVAAGDKIAIVGPSGSGKSTLLSLLPRFYDVTDGAITIDGQDIRNVMQDSLRRNIGIVFQETFLFYGSIQDNLMFVNPGKTKEDMYEACKIANIYDTIMEMPHTFDTLVGERGVTLSGGQKQRLAIARVILKDPAIVILDEATSAVDTTTENLIQQSVEKMLEGRTAFIIAHRLSTIKKCNRIIVLDNKRIAESGTHDELLAQKGIYYRMHKDNKI